MNTSVRLTQFVYFHVVAAIMSGTSRRSALNCEHYGDILCSTTKAHLRNHDAFYRLQEAARMMSRSPFLTTLNVSAEFLSYQFNLKCTFCDIN